MENLLLLQAIEKEVKKDIDEAEKKAKTGKDVSTDELATDIYAVSEDTVKNVSPFAPLTHKRVGKPINL